MGVVQLFEARGSLERWGADSSIIKQNKDSTGTVVELTTNKKIANDVPALPVYRQLEVLLIHSGVDMENGGTARDFKMISYLIQGMIDRSTGASSHRRLMLDMLIMTFGECEIPTDTEELFGDLIRSVDDASMSLTRGS